MGGCLEKGVSELLTLSLRGAALYIFATARLKLCRSIYAPKKISAEIKLQHI